MENFYEEVEIVFTAKVVRIKKTDDRWISDLYNQLDYVVSSDKNMLVGTSVLDVKGKANEDTHHQKT